MKLLYCLECHEIFSLDFNTKTCKCNKSSGRYEADGLNVLVEGDCLVVGFHNGSFTRAKYERLTSDRRSGAGFEFTAFFCPAETTTVNHKRTKSKN